MKAEETHNLMKSFVGIQERLLVEIANEVRAECAAEVGKLRARVDELEKTLAGAEQ